MPQDVGLLAFLLGLGGVASNFIWPLFQGRTSMLVVQAIGAFLFAAHYFLIEANTATAMLVLAGLQAILAIPLGTRPGFRLIYLLSLPVIGLGVFLSWQGLPSLFAALGFATISLGRYQTNVITFRALLLACIPFWLVHNLMVWSIPGLLSDGFSFAAGAWMLVVTIRAERRLAPPA